jgi:RNA polymerase sigma-70 factor (ECF subfamily)
MDRSRTGIDVLQQLGGLRRYALSLTRHESDAEDLVQETLLKAYSARTGLKSDRKLRGWLMSILHNLFIDGRRQRLATDQRDQAAATDDIVPASQEDSVRLQQVRRAFFQLPDEQREALHLVSIEELSYQEAAEVLGVPVGTIMSRIARARERLRAIEDAGQPSDSRLRIVGGSRDID